MITAISAVNLHLLKSTPEGQGSRPLFCISRNFFRGKRQLSARTRRNLDPGRQPAIDVNCKLFSEENMSRYGMTYRLMFCPDPEKQQLMFCPDPEKQQLMFCPDPEKQLKVIAGENMTGLSG